MIRGVGRAAPLMRLILLSSNFDTALGLRLDLAETGSTIAVGLRCELRPRTLLFARGVMGDSFSSGAAVIVCVTGLDRDCPPASPNARHSSVRLRQTLSALRRSWRSVMFVPDPMALAPLDIGPSWPEVPIIEESAMASVAADSRAR